MANLWSTWYLIGFALFFGLAAVGVFVWVAKSGYFSDVEEVKYSIFRYQEEESKSDNWT